MKYMVVYDSVTGNTEKIAMTIFEALPEKLKDIQKVTEVTGKADVYIVGFWNYKGTCSAAIMEFLSELHHKKVVLFGTCGGKGNQNYYDQVLRRVAAFIPDDNEYLGGFLCAGKLPSRIIDHYRYLLKENDTPQTRSLIQMYEHGLMHPNQEDFEASQAFILDIIQKEEQNGTR